MFIEDKDEGYDGWHLTGVLTVVALLLVMSVFQTAGLSEPGEDQTIQVAQEAPHSAAGQG